MREMSFWVIDAEPSEAGALLYTITEDGVLEEKKAIIQYKGYIKPNPSIDPETAAVDLEESGLALKAWVEEWKLPPHYRDEASIIVYTVDSLYGYKKITSITLRKGIGVIVNDYPDPLIEALWNSGYHPLHKLVIRKGKPVIIEDPSTLDYEVPPLRIAQVNHDPYTGKYRVQLASTTVHVYNECSVVDLLEDHQSNLIIAPIETRHRLQGYCSKSRQLRALWIDNDNMLTGIHGLIEWSRLARIPLRYAAQSSIGRILTTIEAFEARSRKYLAVRNHGRIEPARGIVELAEYDRGGAVYTPRPGVYMDVVQVDYNSLYPSIISRYNISGETVDDPHCSETITPPGTSHKVCVERRGIVPSVMDKLIPRKDGYKKLQESSDDPGRAAVLEERRSAVKWILVASFGYLGYRNSLFGSIMAHETVTGASRSIMAKSKRIVENMGYRVIHVLVDSLFTQVPHGSTMDKCHIIAEEVSRGTGFKARCEAVYKWLVIPRTEYGSGAANKYLGLLHNGELKAKGLLAVRRDTPPLLKEFQWKLMEVLAKQDPESIRDACSELRTIYNEYANRIIKGKPSPRSLVIRRRISSPTWRFNQRILQASTTRTGGMVEYIVAPGKIPVDPNLFNGSLDRRFYLRMLTRGYNEVAGEICGYQPVNPGL
jgi:DNA polymerase I